MILPVVLVILWESVLGALGIRGPLPDLALAFAVAFGMRHRDEQLVGPPLILGAAAGLFTSAPWALRPLECLVGSATAAWSARAMGPAGLLGETIIVLGAVIVAACAQCAALAVGPGGDFVGVFISAILAAPIALVGGLLVSGRRRYGR